MLSLLACLFLERRWDSPSGERVAQSLRNYYFQFLPPTSSETREEKRERDRKKKSENKPWELRTRVEFSSQKEITSVFNIDLRVSSNTLLLCRAKVVGNKLAIDRGIENRDPRGWKDRGGGGKKRDRTGGY